LLIIVKHSSHNFQKLT